MAQNLAPFYDGWRRFNDRLIEGLGGLSTEQLGVRAAPDQWPIWALAAHTAAARVYWLCHILKEPGAETTPFTDASGEGWEDDLTHPRSPAEVASALESSWAIVQRCLETWTTGMLEDEFERPSGHDIQIHTRQSVLMRLITHDAYHCGEISQLLGSHGLNEVYFWAPSRIVPAR
jgi:uncharacterized damage-inducible protein DinB